MGQSLYHQYAIDSGVSYSDVRAAVRSLSDDDLSVGSPISGGGEEVGIDLTGEGSDPGGILHIRVEGHDGEWTKTSEKALSRTIRSVNGVGKVIESQGGYEGDVEDAGEDEDSEEEVDDDGA